MPSSPGPDVSGGAAFAADTTEIRAAGRTLMQRARTVAAARTFGPVDGVGEAAAAEQAAAAFRQQWQDCLTQWCSAVGTYGDALTAIAADMEGVDAANSGSWRSIGGGMPR